MERITAENEPHDVDLSIKVTVNEIYQAYDLLTPEPPVAGLSLYRSAPKRTHEHGWQEGCSYVFMGNNWSIANSDKHTLMKSNQIKGRSYTAAHMITLAVQGDPVRARATLEKINWELLKGLLK